MLPVEISKDFPALACGVDRDEGVIVAYIPKNEEGVLTMQHAYRDGTRSFTAYSMDGKLLDMVPEDRKNMKWWQVREAARALELDIIEPIHSCAAEDFRLSCLLDKQLPRPEAHSLAFRRFSKGPWITIDPEDMETE